MGKQRLHPVNVEIGKDEIWDKNKIGIQIEFIYVTETEAPSEIMIYFPEHKAFCVAEEINHTMHNLITLRGAKVRNGLLWSKAIDKVIEKYGSITRVSFSTHHWPTWSDGGKDDTIKSYWENQRDLYRYLHDRTLNLINRGYTPNEIAEEVKLPENLANEFYNCEYYGTISHNVKAQYQLYLGWFDGNPANLNPLPPEEASKEYVEAMGGANNVLGIAEKAYKTGEYRWAAMLLNHLVFCEPKPNEPDKDPARILLANVYTQLRYQSESGPWRNFYLTAAKELTTAPMKVESGLTLQEIENLNSEQLFDFMAINLDTKKAEEVKLELSIHFSGTTEYCTLILQNGALTNRINHIDNEKTADISLTLQHFKDILVDNQKCNENEKKMLNKLLELLDFKTDRMFNIVEP